MNIHDLKALRIPLAMLLAVLATAAGLIYYSNAVLAQARLELTGKQAQLREARLRLQTSGDQKAVIVRYLDDYRRLQQLGFIDEEQRINWLDGLRLSNQQLRLFGVDYEIGTQQPYPYASELNPGQLALFQSVMKVHLSLLHEADLQHFLGILSQQGAGVFSVNECLLERSEAPDGIRYQPNLRANCELAWITMRPGAPGEKK